MEELKNKINKIIYQNSDDDSTHLRIQFERVDWVLDQIMSAIEDHYSQTKKEDEIIYQEQKDANYLTGKIKTEIIVDNRDGTKDLPPFWTPKFADNFDKIKKEEQPKWKKIEFDSGYIRTIYIQAMPENVEPESIKCKCYDEDHFAEGLVEEHTDCDCECDFCKDCRGEIEI